LPDIALDRQYMATITRGDGYGLTASLTGATFITSSTHTANRWYGHSTQNGATFFGNLEMYYYSGYRDFAEVLPDDSVYMFSGTIDVRLSGDNLVGILAGTIRIGTSHLVVTAQCQSEHHAVTFTRQTAPSSLTRTRR
jgi:hypothetical protein